MRTVETGRRAPSRRFRKGATLSNVNWARFVLGTLVVAALGADIREHAGLSMIPLGFYSESVWIWVGLYQLVFSIIAAIVGAAPYT